MFSNALQYFFTAAISQEKRTPAFLHHPLLGLYCMQWMPHLMLAGSQGPYSAQNFGNTRSEILLPVPN